MSIRVGLALESTASEIEKAINGLANGKAPGNDAIPPDVIEQGTPVLLPHLHEHLYHSKIKVIEVIETTIVESLSYAL